MVNKGDIAWFTVVATGAGQLVYQWFANGVLMLDGGRISGSTTSTMTINGALDSDPSYYTVRVSNPVGFVDSWIFTLRVSGVAAIGIPPQSQTANYGETVQLYVLASGYGDLGYQWQKNGVNLSDGDNVSGSTTPLLTLSDLTSADEAAYTVLISNINGTISSDPVSVVVIYPASITQPQGQVTNGFGFTISGINGLVCVVEACTNLSNPVWIPMQTNTLTGVDCHFTDPQWMKFPSRFYRLRWP